MISWYIECLLILEFSGFSPLNLLSACQTLFTQFKFLCYISFFLLYLYVCCQNIEYINENRLKACDNLHSATCGDVKANFVIFSFKSSAWVNTECLSLHGNLELTRSSLQNTETIYILHHLFAQLTVSNIDIDSVWFLPIHLDKISRSPCAIFFIT